MSETTELRTDDRVKMENGEDHPGQDPQADIRLSIAERYEQRRMEEMREQHENLGLPPPDIDGTPVEPEERREPEPQVAQDDPADAAPDGDSLASERQAPQPPVTVQQPTYQAPQLIPMALPDGRVTHVTPEQFQELAALGMRALVPRPAPPPQATQQLPAPAQRPTFDETRAASIAQRLSFGTVDEQKQALMEFHDAVRQPPPQQIDVDAIRRQAAQDALQLVQHQQNLAQIGHEYPDIFQDVVLSQVAAVQLNQLRGNPMFQHTRSDLDQYREACNLVRSRFQPASAPQPQPPVQSSNPAPQAAPTIASRQATLERKRAAPSIPAVADRRMTADGDTAPREKTASEVIADMRKQRHQAPV